MRSGRPGRVRSGTRSGRTGPPKLGYEVRLFRVRRRRLPLAGSTVSAAAGDGVHPAVRRAGAGRDAEAGGPRRAGLRAGHDRRGAAGGVRRRERRHQAADHPADAQGAAAPGAAGDLCGHEKGLARRARVAGQRANGRAGRRNTAVPVWRPDQRTGTERDPAERDRAGPGGGPARGGVIRRRGGGGHARSAAARDCRSKSGRRTSSCFRPSRRRTARR